MRTAKTLLITILILVVYLLHQDSWNWTKAEPFVFGFLPIGLAYHAGYSIVAAVLMAILVKLSWPKHLEDIQPKESQKPANRSEGH